MVAPEHRLTVDVVLNSPRAPKLALRLDTKAPFVAVTGASGAGKTTLLRILAGVESRAQGTVKVGEALWQDSAARLFVPPWQRHVGWVPQDALLFPHLSVRENLTYANRHGTSAEALDRVSRLVEVEGLLDRRPRHLSGGERQRVALGRALLASPRLLLLDEPFAALDRPLRRRVTALLSKVRLEWAIPTVLVSHDFEDVAALSQAVFHLADGTLTREASS